MELIVHKRQTLWSEEEMERYRINTLHGWVGWGAETAIGKETCKLFLQGRRE